MNTNVIKWTYRITTGLFTLLIGGGVAMYFAQYDMVSAKFTALNYPTYLVYPLAVAKTLGLIAIISRKSNFLKELAYAGFFYELLLGISAHVAIGDGEAGGAAVAFLLVCASYMTQRALAASQDGT